MAIKIKSPMFDPFPPFSNTAWHIYADTDNPDRGPVLVCKAPLSSGELLSLDKSGMLRIVNSRIPNSFEFVRSVPMANFNIEEI